MADSPLSAVSRNCKWCGESFSYLNSRGRARSYCARPCQAAASMEAFKTRRAQTCCSINGCDKPVQSVGRQLCAAHFALLRRTGKYEKRKRPTRSVDKRGYVRVKLPELPISDHHGWCYEHRAVAFEKYGADPTPCHWCGTIVAWEQNHIDHLDECKGNNIPGNLVISCGPCNRARGAVIPFVRGLTEGGLKEFISTLDLMRRSDRQAGGMPEGYKVQADTAPQACN